MSRVLGQRSQAARRGCIAITILLALPLAAQVRYEDILKGPGQEWLTYAGDYASQRHSPLDQINLETVNALVPKWVYHFRGARRLETSPLVHDGIMYVTNTNELHALDARSGRRLWAYFAEGVKRQRANRKFWSGCVHSQLKAVRMY